jgi:hypothetical protein
MRTLLLSVTLLASAAPALAQQQPTAIERKVLAERVCEDGATTTVAVSGNLIMVEYFSAPRADGTVAGYEDAYDLKEIGEAKAQFDALSCPRQS